MYGISIVVCVPTREPILWLCMNCATFVVQYIYYTVIRPKTHTIKTIWTNVYRHGPHTHTIALTARRKKYTRMSQNNFEMDFFSKNADDEMMQR